MYKIMAGSRCLGKCIPFLLLNIFVTVDSSKLNVPRVLLPVFTDFSTKFTLEATEGGCYRWSTTRIDIIQITPLDEDVELECSVKAVVSTVTKEAARNIAVVLAEDVHTKQMLRCDVIIDAIHSLTISTTTRELFMEEAPEAFQVQAHDDQGNEFSTLEGIEFDWNIVSLGPNKDTVLRYIAFRDSPYESPPAIDCLENQDKKGYMILLEGIKSGSAKVSVRLPDPEYKHVNSSEVQLMVVANLLLTPPEVHLMVGDVVPFKIFYLNGGRMEEIILPDSQYYIEAEDTSVASSIKLSGNVTALKEGKTRIVLRDRNVGKNDPLLKLPAATVYVVMPEYLVINILPNKNWAIIVGDHHDIVAEVYSKTDHKLYLGGGVQINIEVAPEFAILSRSTNGSWITGYGQKASVVSVIASLESVYNDKVGKLKFETPLTCRGDLLIYPRITIAPSEVILPWDPVERPSYDVDLVVKGGDGRFIFTSSDHSIGVVSQTGHVRTHSNGYFEVSAAMQRNHHNRQTAKFIILPPSKLEIVEFVMEAEVGSPVYLHIALYAEQTDRQGNVIQVPFTKCQDLPFQIKQSDLKFKRNKTASVVPVGISCGNIAMVGLNVGTSKVTITYFQEGRALEDSVTVSAFKPLTLLQPKREIVLAVGSSVNLVYTGGPRPILGRLADHKRTVVSDNGNVAQAQDMTQFHSIPGEDFTVVQVLCKQLGETDIKLMISNTPASPNCKAQSSSIQTRVTCGKPRKIMLQPELVIANADACPMDLGSGSAVVQSTQDIDIDVMVFDDCGTKFLNISSFLFSWLLTPSRKGHLHSSDGVFPRNITVGTVPVAYKSFQSVKPLLDIGSITINVTITGYNPTVLKKNKIVAESPPFKGIEDAGIDLPPITASLSLYLVDDPIVTPSIVTIFNHPGNKKIISVTQGSGYFELALNTEGVALVKYLENSREIEISPLRSGELTIQLTDLCLVTKPALLFVSVVSVGIVRIEMTDKVEIGKCISCIVRLYDENDNLMDIPEPGMVDLRPEFQNKIANIQRVEEDPNHPLDIGEIHYILTGVEVGNTKLVFTVVSNDEDVTSAPADLQVFLPLKLYPRNGTILIGSNLQFTVKGGPQPDANIEFVAANTKVATISEKGIIIGKSFGSTKIIAQAVGIHPYTGQRLIYSEDSVELQVVALQGVKIQAPLTRFKVGATVPFWCHGLPDISPLLLGTVENPPIYFHWAVEDRQVADLDDVYKLIGILYKSMDRVVMRTLGLQPGKTRLLLNATVAGATVNKPSVESVMFQTSIDIEVIQAFSLVFPKDLTGKSLLMAPFSEVQLKTNMDESTSRITFTLPSDAPSTELLADKSVTPIERLVTVSPTGLLKSHGTLGHGMLVVIATDELGLKQRLNFVVEVKPMHYMLLNVRGDWRIHADTSLDHLPLGTEFKLRATFHDIMGIRFNGVPSRVQVRSSRCDLVKITHSTTEVAVIWIQTRRPGSTMLKIWADGIESTASYTKISVENVVKPLLDHLTAGDIVCLWTPVVSRYNTPGTWSSSDNGLMAINPALDIGFVGNREGVVILSHTYHPASPLHIQILPVAQIEFLLEPKLILTNGEVNEVTRIPLVLQSEKSVNIKTNNLIQGWRCRTDVRKLVRPSGFNCFMAFTNESTQVTAYQVFNVTNSFVPQTGQYACKLINLEVNSSDVAVLRTNLTLWAVTEDGDVSSEKLNIPFVPNVHAPSEVYLRESSNTGEVVVIGLSEVLEQIEVNPADSSILYVDKGVWISPTSKKYEIQLIDYHWRLAGLEEAMGIRIMSPITSQTVMVMVKVSGDLDQQICMAGHSPVLMFLQNYKYALAMTIAMLVIFFITFYFYSNYMQPVVHVNVNPASRAPFLGPPNSVGHRCAAMYPNTLSPTMSPTANVSVVNRSSTFCNRQNCSCSPGSRCNNREPIYGDSSTFYTNTPETRKNSRFL